MDFPGGEAMKTLMLIAALGAVIPAAPVLAQHDHAGQAAPGRAGGGERPPGRPALREWTKQPLLIGRGERGERNSALVSPRNLAASNVTVFASEGAPERLKVDYPVESEGARISTVAPKTGNYHWVVAREETPEAIKVASTAWYFGNPGASPKDLLTVPKHELEIVPAPLPREHRRYREAEKWNFLVRFEGKPLASQPVVMETEFGSRVTAVTNAEGIATLVFPRDFKPAPEAAGEGDERRRRGGFVLSTEKTLGDKRYVTAFNHQYGQDPERNRSLAWGAAFGILGMVAATPLLRRRKESNGGNDHA